MAAGSPNLRADMRRFLALLVLWAGLLGAGSPAFACATAAAAGDCCPPGAPTGCTQIYEQLDIEAIICCVTVAAPSQAVTAEPGRQAQAAQREHGSADPIALSAPSRSLQDLRSTTRLAASHVSAAHTDASLTYLHTGRLRL